MNTPQMSAQPIALSRPAARRRRFCAALFGGLFALCVVIGKPVYDSHDITLLWSSGSVLLKNLLLFCGIAALAGLAASLLFRLCERFSMEGKALPFADHRLLWPMLILLLLLLWLPGIFSNWPGTVTPDAAAQYSRYLANGVMNYQPPIHTFFIGFCSQIASRLGLDEWIPVYSVLQVLIMAVLLSRIPLCLIRRRANRAVILLSLVWLGPNPILWIMLMTATKDVLFGGFLSAFAAELIFCQENPDCYFSSIRKCSGFVFLLLMTCLTRQNFIYALIIASPFLLAAIGRTHRVKLLLLLVIPIVGYYGTVKIIYPAVGVGGGFLTEAWSVPCQQVATVAQNHTDELTEYDKDQISRYLTWHAIAKGINPRLADPVKDETRYVLGKWNEDLGGFIHLWLSLGLRYPADYITAFLDLNIEFWYPLAEFTIVNDIPVISQLFSTHLPVWVVLLSFFSLISRKRWKQATALLLLLLYWATFLLGPVAEFRYVWPLTLLYPVLIWQLLHSNDSSMQTEAAHP